MTMSPTLVSCTACDREWHSPTMAEGLRAVGSCPRCGGKLAFADGAPEAPEPGAAPAAGADATAPHLVLGVPRR
jgi:uncharacterized paraquat-inducible protein A